MSNPKPGKAEFTVQGACIECMAMGFFVSESDRHGLQVERCDNCSVFAGDDEARGHALRLAVKALKSPRRRTGKRFKLLLECLETMANQTDPPFWNEKPRKASLCGIVKGLASQGGLTTLGVAYCLQGPFIYMPSMDLDREDVEGDNKYVQDNLDRDELEEMLRDAGCVKTGLLWSVRKKNAA